jgi:hypothetical protein
LRLHRQQLQQQHVLQPCLYPPWHHLQAHPPACQAHRRPVLPLLLLLLVRRSQEHSHNQQQHLLSLQGRLQVLQQPRHLCRSLLQAAQALALPLPRCPTRYTARSRQPRS